MAKRSYKISFQIESTKAEAAARKLVTSMTQLDKAATKAGASIDKAFAKLNTSATAGANTATAAVANLGAAHTQAAGAKAHAAAAQKIDVGLHSLQMSAVKFGDLQRAAADKAQKAHLASVDKRMKAEEAAKTRSMVGIDQLRMSGIKMQGDLLRAAERAQAAKDKLVVKSLSNEDVALRARNSMMAKANQARINQAIAAGSAEKKSFIESAAGAMGLEGALTSVAVAGAGIAALVVSVESLAESFVSAKDSALEMARKTLDTLSDLREISAIKEKAFPSDEELKHHLDVRKASGMTHPEAVTLRNELANTMGTVGFDKINQEQRDKLEVFAAQFAARTGGGEGTVKARAGAIGLIPSFMEGNNLQAEDVADAATKVDILLGKGRGTQKQSTEQYAKVLTAMTSGELEGRFHDPYAAAGLTAIASKSGPGSAATAVEQGVRGLERFGKMTMSKGALQSQGETITEAGIEDADNPDVKFRKFFKYLDTKLQKGQSLDKFLQDRGFANQAERRSIGRFYEGHLSGDYERIMDDAAKPVEKGLAAEKAKEYLESKTGRYKIALANRDAATTERGMKHVEYETGRVEAEDDLIREGMDDTGMGKFQQKWESLKTLGFRTGRDVMIDKRMAENRRKQIEDLGGKAEPPRDGMSVGDLAAGFTGGPAGLAGMAGQFLGNNMYQHVFADESAKANSEQEVINELKKANQNLEKMIAEGKAAKAPAAAPPAVKGPPSTIGTLQSMLGW
ncbi:hypothetical protein [Singulisphaera sp. PoT]|uniref:hypothetical protein n=1 Tax=Singulisphaera sp. PoT TaxID=3411797 RepID=UPI003BF45F04